MHSHVGMIKELADVAARELVIEQAVEAIQAAFLSRTLAFSAETLTGIPGVCVCVCVVVG